MQKKRRQLRRTTFVLSTHQTGLSKRLGHPSRQIVRPKKYITTSSSDKDKVTNRKNECDRLDRTIDMESDISKIRDNLNFNKENEAANVFPDVSRFNSLQPIKPTAQLCRSPNVITETCETSSVPQKTYTELLPRNSTSGFNRSESIYTVTDSSNLHMHGSDVGRVSYQEPSSRASFYTSPQNETHQEISTRVIPLYTNLEQHKSQGDKNKSLITGHRSDKEIESVPIIYSEHVLSKQDFQRETRCLREEFNEHYQILNAKLDKLLRKGINIMPPKPPSFPLQSVQQVEEFNNISQEEYENAVEYLHFVGGFTVHDAVKCCMKEVMTDDTIKHYSVWGERGNLPLCDTKLIKAIYDAVGRNRHFPRPMRDEFFREVGEAVRFGKQRNRNIMKRADERGRGRRQRLRREAENHLFGILQDDPHNIVNVENSDHESN